MLGGDVEQARQALALGNFVSQRVVQLSVSGSCGSEIYITLGSIEKMVTCSRLLPFRAEHVMTNGQEYTSKVT